MEGERRTTRRIEGESVTPEDMEGTLYAASLDSETTSLLKDLEAHGHHLAVSSTQLEYKAPYVSAGRAEVIGDKAIRDFFGLTNA